MPIVLTLIAIVVIGAIVFFVRRKESNARQALQRADQISVAIEQPPAPEPAKSPARIAIERARATRDAADEEEASLLAASFSVAPNLADLELGPPVMQKVERSTMPSWPVPSPGDDLAAVKKGLESTRGGFIARLARMLGRKPKIDARLLEEIEEVLLTADIGVKTTQRLIGKLQDRLSKNELQDDAKVWDALREDARAILANKSGPIDFRVAPTVILVVGVNGVGKTTTIGKLASRYMHDGKSVLLAAGDTFRAAAVLQLEVWGRRIGCTVVKGKENADPSAVIYEAIQRAIADNVEIVIADTAGRLHTKAPLMEELRKIHRTIEKALGGRPVNEVLLVLDSTNGQNAIQQAALFREALPVSGIALTKLDGTAKGGVVLGIVDEHQIPVRYIGVGERVEDLRDFDDQTFVDALFERPEDDTIAA